MKSVWGKGIKNEKEIIVRIKVHEKSYTIDVNNDTGTYKEDIDHMLRMPTITGGTYVIPPYTLLKAYYVLDDFFNHKWDSKITGKMEEIPSKPGRIY